MKHGWRRGKFAQRMAAMAALTGLLAVSVTPVWANHDTCFNEPGYSANPAAHASTQDSYVSYTAPAGGAAVQAGVDADGLSGNRLDTCVTVMPNIDGSNTHIVTTTVQDPSGGGPGRTVKVQLCYSGIVVCVTLLDQTGGETGTTGLCGNDVCAKETIYADGSSYSLAAAGTGNASGAIAASGTGDASGSLLGLSGTGYADGGVADLSGTDIIEIAAQTEDAVSPILAEARIDVCEVATGEPCSQPESHDSPDTINCTADRTWKLGKKPRGKAWALQIWTECSANMSYLGARLELLWSGAFVKGIGNSTGGDSDLHQNVPAYSAAGTYFCGDSDDGDPPSCRGHWQIDARWRSVLPPGWYWYRWAQGCSRPYPRELICVGRWTRFI